MIETEENIDIQRIVAVYEFQAINGDTRREAIDVNEIAKRLREIYGNEPTIVAVEDDTAEIVAYVRGNTVLDESDIETALHEEMRKLTGDIHSVTLCLCDWPESEDWQRLQIGSFRAEKISPHRQAFLDRIEGTSTDYGDETLNRLVEIWHELFDIRAANRDKNHFQTYLMQAMNNLMVLVPALERQERQEKPLS